MNMSLNASIECLDGRLGVMKELLFDPMKNQVTHFVIKNRYNKKLIIIPTSDVEYSSDSVVTIDKRATDFKKYPPLYTKKIKTYDVNDSEYTDWGSHSNAKYSYRMEPYHMTYVPEEEEVIKKIPNGDIELEAGMCIKDVKGKKIGHIDEIMLNKDQNISSIIIKTVHLLSIRNVEVLFDNIKKIDHECIGLTLDKTEVDNLPNYEEIKPWK